MELCLGPLVSRAVSRGMSRHLGTQEVFMVSVCRWVELCSCPIVVVLAWDVTALESIGYRVRQGFVDQTQHLEVSHWLKLPDISTSVTWPLRRNLGPSHPPPQETSKPQQAVLAKFNKSMLLPLRSQCIWDLVMGPPKMELCFIWLCGASANQACWSSKLNALGTLPANARPQGRGLTWFSELSLLWENLCDRIIL